MASDDTLIHSNKEKDVYELTSSKQIEIVVPHTSPELFTILKLQGTFGAPELVDLHYYNDYVFHQQPAKHYRTVGICMKDYGENTLECYKTLSPSSLKKILFNLCFIAYTFVSKHQINHCDLHRKNAIFTKLSKSFSKTYKIGNASFQIKDQHYSVTVIDFEHARAESDMHDIKQIVNCFSSVLKYKDTFSEFFLLNFPEFLI